MYIQSFLLAVPEANKDAYLAMAQKGAQYFFDLGAVEVVEAWEDDVTDGEVTDFRMATKAEEGEKIVTSWIIWPDKATCQQAQDIMTEDPDLGDVFGDMPFDGMRMMWGGFEPLLVKRKE